jgi:protein-disulfide isomerase
MTRVIFATALAVAGLFGTTALLIGQNSGMAIAQEADAEASESTSATVEEMALGNADAPVTIVEYASFTCPHCRNFHDTVFPDLKADYIDTGKVHFIYREVYFDRYGLWAGMLARCGGADRYFGFVDVLYETQSEWVSGGDPAGIADNLRKLGRTAGLSDEEVNACLSDQAKAEALVAEFEKNSQADNIESTPSFVINGTKHSNMPYDEFREILDDELES